MLVGRAVLVEQSSRVEQQQAVAYSNPAAAPAVVSCCWKLLFILANRRSPGKVVHALKYVVRSSFRNYEWGMELAVELRGYGNLG